MEGVVGATAAVLSARRVCSLFCIASPPSHSEWPSAMATVNSCCWLPGPTSSEYHNWYFWFSNYF